MNQSLVGAAAIGLVAVTAGIAVAGLPSGHPDGSLRIEKATVTHTNPPRFVVPVGTETLEAATTTTTPATLESTVPVVSDPVVSGPIVAGPVTDRLVERSDLVLVVVNAGSGPGSATATAALLMGNGYTRAVPMDADQGSDVSVVYYRAGRLAEARRLVEDLGLHGVDVIRLSKATTFAVDREVDLAVLLGRDVR